jgi:hypothetical protein
VGAELDWNAGLVGAPQPHPSIAAAGDDAIVEQNGNRRHCAVLAAELGWNAGLVSAPPPHEAERVSCDDVTVGQHRHRSHPDVVGTQLKRRWTGHNRRPPRA